MRLSVSELACDEVVTRCSAGMGMRSLSERLIDGSVAARAGLVADIIVSITRRRGDRLGMIACG